MDVFLPPKTSCSIDYCDSKDSPLAQKIDGPPPLAKNNLGELVNYFSFESNILYRSPTTKRQKGAMGARWWAPIKELAELCDNDIDKTKQLIKKTIRRMRDDGLTISAPQSILSVAIDESAKAKSRSVSIW